MIPDKSRINRTECHACHSTDLHLFLPLGDQALANSFLKKEDLIKHEAKYPLEVFYCAQCFFVQLGYSVPPEIMFREYLWVSSTSDTIPVHFAEYAQEVYERFMKPGDLVVEIASNDGCLLKGFKKYDVRMLGVEPARNIAKMAQENGVPTLNEFFCKSTAEKVLHEHGSAKALISNNVFAHVDQLDDFVDGAALLLAPDGVWTIESPHLFNFMLKNEFDTVYHEHISYLPLNALVAFFKRHGLYLYDVKKTKVHGGSIRMYVTKDPTKEHTATLTDMLTEEKNAGLLQAETYTAFGQKVEQLRKDCMDLLHDLKKQGKRIAGYGASAKGNTLLQYFGIGPDLLEYIADKAPLKQGLYTPGTHIPVVPPDRIETDPPDYMFILAWNFADEIMRQQSAFKAKGGKFIVPIPMPQVV